MTDPNVQLGMLRDTIKEQGIENAHLRQRVAELTYEIELLRSLLRAHTAVGAE